MGAFDFLMQGLMTAAEPMMLLYALIGVTLGTAVGVLPGIGPALTVALLLPVTYRLDAAGSLIMFAGIYYGGMYGGSTTSILLNTPGESASIITALEGNKMARKGRGGPALATAAIGSFVAGLIATLLLAFLAPSIVKVALVFGPREYFALMVLCFVTVSAVLGSSALRGLTSLAFGLMLGLVGVDLQTGQPRLTFGVPELLDAILELMPLDTYVDQPVRMMEKMPCDRELEIPVLETYKRIVAHYDPRGAAAIGAYERFAFYDMARQAYAVIQTGERRFYGCFMLRKGVVPPEAK